ncbi:MAG: META domain-containing protein [Chloroflexota bacterium]|nr:META domain-containing protein [Chloroflexota bacterium]
MQRTITPLFLLTALLAACGAGQAPTDPPGSSASDELVVGDWVLTGGSIDGRDAPVLENHRITLTISGGRIAGTAACNSYGGEIRMGEDGLRMENLAQTEMACEDPAMTAEAAYLGAMTRIRQITRDGEELVARGDGVDLRFAALPAPPTSDLVDTRWVLETLVDGDVASAPMGEPATLEFHEDGTFTGSTGCRTFEGNWMEQGDQIEAPTWGMNETTCAPGLSGQDDHVVSVIGDGFIPTIDGELLTLMDPEGIGLVYRSGE